MQDLFTYMAIAVGLAMDAFAVAAATSMVLRTVSVRQVFRFAFHFGLFQALMPLMGWCAGQYMAEFIRVWDHWVAFGLLSCVGGRTIVAAVRGGEEQDLDNPDPTRGMSLVVLSVATSIDALAVGISFAMIQVDIWQAIAVIGVITAGLTTVGMLWGSRLGARFGKGIEIAGGLVLIGIGLKILVQHLLEQAA